MSDNGGLLAGLGLRGYLEEIDHYDDELNSLKGEYMQACQGPRAAQKEILQRVKDSDIDLVAFKVMLKEHRDMRAHERRIADLDLAQRSNYESIIAALGDYGTTPLGSAALKQAQSKAEPRAVGV